MIITISQFKVENVLIVHFADVSQQFDRICRIPMLPRIAVVNLNQTKSWIWRSLLLLQNYQPVKLKLETDHLLFLSMEYLCYALVEESHR